MGQVNAVAGRNGSPGGTPAPLRPGDAKLWKAAKDFQEVFLTQFTQAMRSSERDNEFFEECPAGRRSTECSTKRWRTRCRRPERSAKRATSRYSRAETVYGA